MTVPAMSEFLLQGPAAASFLQLFGAVFFFFAGWTAPFESPKARLQSRQASTRFPAMPDLALALLLFFLGSSIPPSYV